MSPRPTGIDGARETLHRFVRSVGQQGHRPAVAVVDQLVASTTTFLTGVIVGRGCTQEEFGLFMLGFSIVLVAIDVQTSLISSPYMVFRPRLHGRDERVYLGSTLIHGITLSLAISLLLGVATAVLLLSGGHVPLATATGVLALVISFILFREFARRICFANMQFTSALIIDGGGMAVQLGAMLVLAQHDLLSAAWTFVAIGFAGGITGIQWIVRARREIELRLEEVAGHFKQSWMFGRWITASGVLGTLSSNAYPWILATIQGTAAAGDWAACFGIASIASPALVGAQNFVGPKLSHSFAHGGVTRLRRVVMLLSGSVVLVTLVLTIGFMFFGGKVVALVYGSDYAGNGPVVMLLAVNVGMLAFRFLFSRALFVMEHSRTDFVMNAAGAPILVILGMCLTIFYGIVGAAAGLAAGNFLVAMMKFIAFNWLCRSPRQPEAL